MSISSTNRKAGPYSGNGVTVAFPFSFKVFSAGDVRVVQTSPIGVESDMILGSSYSVTLNANQDANPGGTVTTTAAPATDYLITIASKLQNLQPVVLTNMGGFYPAVINDALDRATIQIQQLAETVSRAAVVPVSAGLTNITIEPPSAGQYLRWNLAGTGIDATSAVYDLGNFLQSGAGAVARTAMSKMGEVVSAKDFGATGNGASNDTAAIAAFVAHLMLTGARGYVPAGIYLTDAQTFTMTGDVDIVCERGAVFKYRTAESSPLFKFTAAVRDIYSLSWQGGVIDNSGGDFVSAEQSNACVDLVRLRSYIFDGVHFRGEATYGDANDSGTGTDCGITPTDCKNGRVTNCIFEGQGDAGIYVTGGASEASVDDDGGDLIVFGNHFFQSDQAVTIKRNSQRTLIIGNTIKNCRVGITSLDVPGISPGRAIQIIANTFKFIETRAIELRQFGGHVVTNNIIEDFGRDASGGVSSMLYAVRILGGSGSIITGNHIRCREWVADSALKGIYIADGTFNSVTYNPAENLFQANRFENVPLAIYEDGSVGINHYLENIFSSVTTPYTITNNEATIRWINSSRNWNAYGNKGNVGGGEDTLNSITLPAGTLNYEIAGPALNGRRLRIVAWGSTANNSNAKEVKLYFGETALITTTMTTNQFGRWQITAEIVRSGATAQKATAQLLQGGTTSIVDVETSTPAETLSSDIVVRVAATGVADNDILNNCLSLEVVG